MGTGPQGTKNLAALRKADRQLRAAIDGFVENPDRPGAPDATAEQQLAQALALQARNRLGAFLRGVRSYRQHPYRRRPGDHPKIWQDGSSCLFDHRPAEKQGKAPVALLVPSLINRSYIFDLMPDRSFCDALNGRNIRALRLSWGVPGEAEKSFGLADYVTRRLIPALAQAVSENGGAPVPLIGYCMGGTLATAAAMLRPDLVSSLVLLAAPWDFHVERAAQAKAMAALFQQVAPLFKAQQTVPVDYLQMLFASIDPFYAYDKFRHFADLSRQAEDGADPALSAQINRFVALEDWLNDGVPVSLPVAMDCLQGWYGENRPAEGYWSINGQTIEPEKIAVPSLSVIPRSDRIVPPASAQALAAILPRDQQIWADTGHIGMMAGRQAKRTVWDPVMDWIQNGPE